LVSLAAHERGGLGVTLLADLRTVFGDADHMGTDEILTALHELEEAPWADLKGKPLDARGLSWRLGKDEVKPRQVKAINRKGYRREDLADEWSRYLPQVSEVSAVSDAEEGREAPWGDLELAAVVSDGSGSMCEPIPSRAQETGLSLPPGGSETSETAECPLHHGNGRPQSCWTCEQAAS
jgi:hypothetical protein